MNKFVFDTFIAFFSFVAAWAWVCE
jgi:hypothetical protein